METSNKFQCAWIGFLAGCTVAVGPLAMLNLYFMPCEQALQPRTRTRARMHARLKLCSAWWLLVGVAVLVPARSSWTPDTCRPNCAPPPAPRPMCLSAALLTRCGLKCCPRHSSTLTPASPPTHLPALPTLCALCRLVLCGVAGRGYLPAPPRPQRQG